MGILLTKGMGNVLTEPVGKVLDIYRSLLVALENASPVAGLQAGFTGEDKLLK